MSFQLDPDLLTQRELTDMRWRLLKIAKIVDRERAQSPRLASVLWLQTVLDEIDAIIKAEVPK